MTSPAVIRTIALGSGNTETRGWKFEIAMSAGLGAPEAAPLGVQTTVSSLRPHADSPLCPDLL